MPSRGMRGLRKWWAGWTNIGGRRRIAVRDGQRNRSSDVHLPGRLDVDDGPGGLFALLRDHGQLHLARLNIEHGLCRIPLRKDRVFLGGGQTRFPVCRLW